MQSINVFIAMGTQWRMGPNGPSGLDYNVLPVVMDALVVPAEARPDIFRDVIAMEAVALDCLRRLQA